MWILGYLILWFKKIESTFWSSIEPTMNIYYNKRFISDFIININLVSLLLFTEYFCQHVTGQFSDVIIFLSVRLFCEGCNKEISELVATLLIFHRTSFDILTFQTYQNSRKKYMDIKQILYTCINYKIVSHQRYYC